MSYANHWGDSLWRQVRSFATNRPGPPQGGLPGADRQRRDSLILILQRLELGRWYAPDRPKQWMYPSVWKCLRWHELNRAPDAVHANASLPETGRYVSLS